MVQVLVFAWLGSNLLAQDSLVPIGCLNGHTVWGDPNNTVWGDPNNNDALISWLLPQSSAFATTVEMAVDFLLTRVPEDPATGLPAYWPKLP
jgi:hypothetical protein